MDYAYYNGEYLPYDKMRIPLFDRSIYFADAIYEVIIGKEGRVYQLDEHLERLKNGAGVLEIPLQQTIERIKEAIPRLINFSRLDSYTIYLQVSRNANQRRHFYTPQDEPTLLITISEFQHAIGDSPINLVSLADKRYDYCNVKTTNLLPAVLASGYALKCGFDEAVFHTDGTVSECSRSNISILTGDSLITHPKSDRILPGITRANLINISNQIGIKVKEEPFTLTDLLSADEVIISSTTKFIKRCRSLDEKKIGMKNGELFALLLGRLIADFEINCR